jgi:YfiH family protein
VFSLGALGTGDRGGGFTVGYCFSDRHGGSSESPYSSLNLSNDVGDEAARVAANRASLLGRVGLAEGVWLRAEHGARIGVVEAGSGGQLPDRCDGLVTRRFNVGLGALSADCALIVLADPAAGVVGVVHCGRPGLVAGVVSQAVSALHGLGAEHLVGVVGPTICGDCYELPVAMAEAVFEKAPAARARTGHVDIRAGVAAQLTAAGVDVRRLVGGCTKEDPDSFSYRRDGTTGRMAALVWMTATPSVTP